MNSLNNFVLCRKKVISAFLTLILLVSALNFSAPKVYAVGESDFSVLLEVPDYAYPEEQFTVTVDVVDIIYPSFDEGQGIFGAEIFLYYDSNVLTPIKNSFSAVVPSKWDSFDNSSTAGIWGFYTVFDGLFTNGAVNDGDISFTVSFEVAENANMQDIYFYISDCECSGYSNDALLKIQPYESSANCTKVTGILQPEYLVPAKNSPFVVDMESGIIYSETPDIDYNAFVSFFEEINGDLSITAFDYEITAENGKYIPAGATITVYHEKTGQSASFTYYLLGDCDCNGSISISDLAVIKLVIVNQISVDGYLKYSMEFEKDGFIRIADYLRLKRYIISK